MNKCYFDIYFFRKRDYKFPDVKEKLYKNINVQHYLIIIPRNSKTPGAHDNHSCDEVECKMCFIYHTGNPTITRNVYLPSEPLQFKDALIFPIPLARVFTHGILADSLLAGNQLECACSYTWSCHYWSWLFKGRITLCTG